MVHFGQENDIKYCLEMVQCSLHRKESLEAGRPVGGPLRKSKYEVIGSEVDPHLN